MVIDVKDEVDTKTYPELRTEAMERMLAAREHRYLAAGERCAAESLIDKMVEMYAQGDKEAREQLHYLISNDIHEAAVIAEGKKRSERAGF